MYLFQVRTLFEIPNQMGRDLHQFLEVKEPYTQWFKRMAEYGFITGQDFSENLKNSLPAQMLVALAPIKA